MSCNEIKTQNVTIDDIQKMMQTHCLQNVIHRLFDQKMNLNLELIKNKHVNVREKCLIVATNFQCSDQVRKNCCADEYIRNYSSKNLEMKMNEIVLTERENITIN